MKKEDKLAKTWKPTTEASGIWIGAPNGHVPRGILDLEHVPQINENGRERGQRLSVGRAKVLEGFSSESELETSAAALPNATDSVDPMETAFQSEGSGSDGSR